jgi:hypothetical protein
MSAPNRTAEAIELRCPMIECRSRMVAPPGDLASVEGCMHLIAVWPPGRMASAVLWGLEGNREFVIRNLRPPEVDAERVELHREALEAAAREFAHEVTGHGHVGALFGDIHERNRVAFEFAHMLLGPDPMVDR